MKKKRLYIVGIGVVMALTTSVSCDFTTVYDRYNHTQISGWEKNDTLMFHVPRVKASGLYEEQLGIRITGMYPFTGLTLIVKRFILPGDRMMTDTLNCKFSDQDGLRMANGVSCFQYRFRLDSVRLNAGDSIVMRVHHDMKREILPGIADIGLRIGLRQMESR